MDRQEKLNLALDDAVNRARLDEVKKLVEAGADVEYRDSFGMTPLMNAAWVAAADIVEYFISLGADPNAVNIDGKTALTLVREIGHNKYGHDSVIGVLERYGQGKPKG